MPKLHLKKEYKKYPEYKDSGVEWLGKIPKDWNAQKVVSVFDFPKDKVTEENYEPLSVTYDGIKKQIENAAKVAEGSLRKHVKIGDIAINGRSDRKGAVGMSEYEGGISLVYNVLRKRNKAFDSKYFHHLFRSNLFSEEFYRWGRGIVDDLWTTRESEIKRIFVTVPNPEEQSKIANYLDEKTAIIEQIIEKKQKLIELLREKRTAVINNAVTKGLDPKVELVESGVEWIGKIPKVWGVQPFKSMFLERFEKNIGVKCNNLFSLSYGKIVNKDINSNEGLLPESFATYQIVKNGDIVFRLTDLQNDKKSLRVGYVNSTEPGIITSAYLAVTPINMDERYAYYLFYTYDLMKVYYSMGGGVRQTLDFHDFRYLPIITPDITEQKDISKYLDYLTSVLDKLVNLNEKSIELLNEFKSSLISNVVTGKVKV